MSRCSNGIKFVHEQQAPRMASLAFRIKLSFKLWLGVALVAMAPTAYAGSDGLERLEPMLYGFISALVAFIVFVHRVGVLGGLFFVAPMAFGVGALVAGAASSIHQSSTSSAPRPVVEPSPSLVAQACSNRLAPPAHLPGLARAEPAHGLAVVLANCVVGDDPSKLELFKLLVPVLAEKVGVKNAQQNGDWCLMIEAIHRGAMVNHLRVLMDLEYPLACASNGQPNWWTATEGRKGEINQDVDARRLEFFKILQDAGVNMHMAVAPTGRNLLHLVTWCDSPGMVLFALRLGIDPSVADPHSNWSPRTEWLLRTLGSQTWDCQLRRDSNVWGPEIFNEIERLMGKPSMAEINTARRSSGQTPLFWVSEEAETLSTMLRLGAQLDVRDVHGNTFLHASQKLDNATLALLRSQPKEVLVSLGKKSDSPKAIPLVSAARLREDEGLVELLCKHGADGC